MGEPGRTKALTGAAGYDASDAKKEGEKAESAEGVKEPAKTARKRAVKEE